MVFNCSIFLVAVDCTAMARQTLFGLTIHQYASAVGGSRAGRTPRATVCCELVGARRREHMLSFLRLVLVDLIFFVSDCPIIIMSLYDHHNELFLHE